MILKKGKLTQLGLFACAVLAAMVAAAGARPDGDAPRTISAAGECTRTVASDRSSIKIDIDEEGLNKALMAGLNIARKSLDKVIDIMENSPKTEVKSNVSVSYESTTSKGEKQSSDIEMPLSFKIPEVDAEEFDLSGFVDEMAGDFPAYDEVVRSDAKYSVSKERLEAEYKACAAEALKDARAKAGAEAAALGLKLKNTAAVEHVENRILEASKTERGAVKISVKLEVAFGVE